jgi:hypothetical protein
VSEVLVVTGELNPGNGRSLWNIVHDDEKGGVSIETVLLIAAVALPILIFVIKYGWPRIKEFFEKGMQDLEEGAEQGGAGAAGGAAP